ncbi:hypothetical protein DEA98_14250 [Brucella pseudogrignonensis]|nr:hypothetical protein [Brucella pseudogrignonensis]
MTDGQAEDAYLSKSDLYTVYSGNTYITGCTVQISRASGEGLTDTLKIDTSDNSNQTPSAEKVRSLNKLVSKTFSGTANQLEQILSPKSVETLIASHQQMLLQLQSSATSITETIAEAHSKLETEFAARAKQLNDDFTLRATNADATLEAERKSFETKKTI